MIKFILFLISLIFIFSCSGSSNDLSSSTSDLKTTRTSQNETSSQYNLSKVECAEKLEAYIFQAESLNEEGIDLIKQWVCVSEKLFFDKPNTNWEVVNPIYIAALDRNDINSAIKLEKEFCSHIEKHHNSGKGNDGYDNGKCNPKNYNPVENGCNFGLCLFTEQNGRVAGSSISSSIHRDGFNLFISSSHDLPMHEDSYGYVTIHEMFHIYQYSNLSKPFSRNEEMLMVGKLGTGLDPNVEVPWWIEGNAVYFGYYKYAKETNNREYFINTMKDSILADWKGNLLEKYLISGKKINEFTWNGEEKKIGYELGAWFVAYLIEQVGEDAVYRFWENLESQGKFEIAFEKYFGKKYEVYIDDFNSFLSEPKDEIITLLDRIYPKL